MIIIVVGIGADDIFVFHDNWKHSKHIKVLKLRVALRMTYTFNKAANAMFITSITTAFSFLATCFTPIMPICSFGIFSCIVIVINYLLIIFCLPNLYLFYERYVRKRFRCFRWLKAKANRLQLKEKFRRKRHKYDDLQEVIIPKGIDLEEDTISQAVDIVRPVIYQEEQAELGFAPPSPDVIEEQRRRNEEEAEKKKEKRDKYKYENFTPLKFVAKDSEEAKYINYSEYQFKRYGCIMKFFDKRLGRLVLKCRWPILLVCFTWLFASVYLGLQIPRQVDKVTMLSRSIPIQ